MMMRRNVAATFVCLIAFFVSLNDAQDAKSSDNDEKESNKRSAAFEGPTNVISGFKPMVSPNYHNANSYYGNPQLLPSAANTFFVKHPVFMIAQPHQHHSAPFASPLVQPSQPTSNYYYSQIRNGHSQRPQHHHQLIPMSAFNQFAFSPILATAAMSPIFHNHHPAYPNFYHHHQTPVNSFYANLPHQIHKIPIYNQQPQTFKAATSPLSSYRPLSPANNVKQTLSSSAQFSHSKPVALKSPSTNANISPLPSTSHVEHNEGAVSYAHFSTPSSSSSTSSLNDGNKGSPISATALTLSQHLPQNQQHHQQQSTYYHHQPKPILSPAYSKLAQYAASQPLSIPSNHYAAQGEHYANNVPFSYAHFSKSSSPSAPSASITTQNGASSHHI